MPRKKTAIQPTTTPPSRPPVVVVLGHVDHGKTTLLDAIRKTDVAAREYGGITQGIGAYQVTGSSPRKITFIDTPGHEAFSKMRSRGVNAADLAVLVVAANDSVMPQTAESIKIIKEAKIPYVVAINKIDLPEANFDKVVKDLLRHEVMLENYGGDVPYVKLSAKKGEGVKELLDLVGLVADVSEIKGESDGPLEAVVIESKMDSRRGPLATVVVRNGTIKVGEDIYVDFDKCRVRSLVNYKNEPMSEAGPGTPAEILGLSKVPSVGARVGAQPPEQATGAQTLQRSEMAGEQSMAVLLKADTVGSLEAIAAKMPGNVNLIVSSVGEISEADVLLAKSTKAIILGFNVKISSRAEKLAETEKVLARTYKIIYELLDELDDAAAGMLTPVETEEVLGVGLIVAEFPYEKLRISGIKVTEGRIARGDLIKIMRGEELVGKSKIKSVRVGKEEINKVEVGRECGVLLEPQLDFKVGDAIISIR